MRLPGDGAISIPLLDLCPAESHAVSLEDRVAQLFEQLREPVYRYVLMLTWNAAESEEITQEAFLRLHLHLAQGGKIENARAWVVRVAHNLAMDRHRSSRPADSLSEGSVKHETEARHASSVTTPEEEALARERFAQLSAAVSALSARQRQCLHLRSEGFRYREIATILGIGESSVIENVRRAIARLARDFYVSR